VGRIGSGVRVSVSFRQKIPAGFCLTMSYGKKSPFSRTTAFLFPLETPLRLSRNMLHGWKDNSMLAKPLAACTYLSSIVSELYDA